MSIIRTSPSAARPLALALLLLASAMPLRPARSEALYGALQLAPLAQGEHDGAEVEQDGAIVPLFAIPAPPTARHTLVPIDELVLVARGTTSIPLSSGSSQVVLRLGELERAPVVDAVARGGRIFVENDLDGPRQVRLVGTRTPTIVEPGERAEVFAGAADTLGALTIEAQETPWRAHIVVTEAPFAVGRLRYDDEGRVRVSFGDVVAEGAAETGEVRVAVWYRGRPVCSSPGAGDCEVTVPGRRTEHGIGLVPIGLSRATLFSAVSAP